MDSKLIVSASPHFRAPETTQSLMLNVILALLPSVVASAVLFGWQTLVVIATAVIACVGFEWLYCKALKKEILVGDLSAVVTGLILALNMPAPGDDLPISMMMAVVGSLIAIVVVKQLFGGLGKNFANPALVGRIALFSGYTGYMTKWVFPDAAVDQLASATPLQVADPGKLSIVDLLMGVHGGTMGEVCIIAILLGFIWLVATHTISPVIPVTYIGTVFVLDLIAGMGVHGALINILSGGLFFGAVFMATDYVTSPLSLKGKLVFSLGLGLLTFAIRTWANMAEGVSFAILLMNLLVPYINDLTVQTPYGYVKPAKTKKEGGDK